MKRYLHGLSNEQSASTAAQHLKCLSALQFLKRYPIFLLAFGPPIFRSNVGIDVTKGVIDFWAFLQVALLGAVSLRAIFRLTAAEFIYIPTRIRSIFKYIFLLGMLYLASTVYSTSRPVSAAYAILNFLTLICVVEFLADVYKEPPDWLQCLFLLRWISFVLLVVVFLTLAISPSLVLTVLAGAGIRLLGGAVAPVTLIAPVITIISAYAFLHSLEPRSRSIFFFLVGLTGSLITQSRGSEIGLLIAIALCMVGWAKTGKRSTFLLIAVFVASILVLAAVIGTVGASSIWSVINRGESAEGISSASGRTDIWKFVVQYCMTHPWGMGYIAGFRTIFREYFALGLQVEVSHIGTAHNAFIQVLADAGWPALAVYLIMLVKIVALGWRFARKRAMTALTPSPESRYVLQCALILLVFCFADGMVTADYVEPLRASYYFQYIFIAVILGISARMLAGSRARRASAAV